jgi:hypothetical protein
MKNCDANKKYMVCLLLLNHKHSIPIHSKGIKWSLSAASAIARLNNVINNKKMCRRYIVRKYKTEAFQAKKVTA